MKIKVNLSTSSIDNALRELEVYKRDIDAKSKKLAERLASLGIQVASIRFNGAYVDSLVGNDTQLSVEQTANGFKIVASGTQTWFIEFGTGVYYNGLESYPNPPGRPANVGGIGTYGKGRGKQSSWGYEDDEGIHITHGMPAAMPMYHATVEMERKILQVAREVFR